MDDDIRLAERADQSLTTGLSCQPADRSRAEAGVLAAYAHAGLASPEIILWCDSPKAGAMAVAMLQTGTCDEPASRKVCDLLVAQGAQPGVTDLGASVRSRIRTRPWGKARSALLTRLGAVGFARHWAATAERPWRQLMDQIVTPVRTRLEAQFSAEGGALAEPSRQALLDAVFGLHEAAWLGAFDQAQPDLAGLAQVAEAAGWWWPFERVVVLTERPTAVHRDNLGRLHHGDGPALSYPDGFGIHAWRGMPIPVEVAAELPSLTVERIRAEDNAEMRRVMIEYFGFTRYLHESGASKVQSDNFGSLWRIDLPNDEPLVMVEVVNATAEPDGSVRTYFLRVPPDTLTAHAGVAWTFGLTSQEYQPLKQT